VNQVVPVHLFLSKHHLFWRKGDSGSIDLFAIVIGLVGGSLGGWG